MVAFLSSFWGRFLWQDKIIKSELRPLGRDGNGRILVRVLL
jgi:hypothetical protein